jgi:hypothetical protein
MACMAFLQEQKTAMARYWDGLYGVFAGAKNGYGEY